MIGLASCASRRMRQYNYLSKTYAEIKHTIPNAQVALMQDSIKILFPENVLFEKNSSKMNPKMLPTIQRLAEALKKYDKTNILINGYTDNTGTPLYNDKLSAKRAQSAKDILMQDSIDDRRIFVWGRGDSNPALPNTSEDNKALNRRVEFIVLYGERLP